MADLWRSQWTTATLYSVDNYVYNNGEWYACTSGHTSDASTEPGVGGSWSSYWYSPWGNWRGDITIGQTYDAGVPAEIEYDIGIIDVGGTEQVYKCILDNTASSSNIPEEGTWDTYWELLMETYDAGQDPDWRDEWSGSSVDYVVNDLCFYDDGGGDDLYGCHTLHTSTVEDTPNTGVGYWVELSNYTYTGTWNSGTTYAVDECASIGGDGGEAYVCIQSHSNVEPDVDPYWESYWVNLEDLIDFSPTYGQPWESDRTYLIDDTCTNHGITWICISAHTSDSTSEPEAGSYWGTYWDYESGARDWEIAGDEWTNIPYYFVDEFVFYDELTYTCLLSHKSNQYEAQREPVVGSQQASFWVFEHHSWKGLWVISTSYIDSDWVIDSSGNVYDCILGNIADATNEPGVGIYWETYWDLRDDLDYRGLLNEFYTNYYLIMAEDNIFHLGDILVLDRDPEDIAYICVQSYDGEGTGYANKRPDNGSDYQNYWQPLLRWADYEAYQNWADSTEYYYSDTVTHAGMTWICVAYHTSDSTSEPYNGTYWTTYWQFVSGSPAASHEADDWATDTLYGEDDVVQNDHLFYVCIVAHQSSSSSEPGTGTYWETYWEQNYPFLVYGTYDSIDYEMPILSTENIYWRNIFGYPCLAVTPLNHTQEGYGDLIPGRYQITFDEDSLNDYYNALSNCDTYYVPHSSAWDTCRENALTNYPPLALVNCPDYGDYDNSNINTSGVEVDVSSGNSNKNIIPGLDIQLTQTPNYNDKFDIIVGGIWVSAESRYVKFLPFGNVLCGANSSSVRLKLKNPFWFDIEDIEIIFMHKITIEQDEESSPIFLAYQSEEYLATAFDEKTALSITFENLVSGSPNTINMLVNDQVYDILDVDADTIHPQGKLLKCDGSTLYRFPDQTKYAGLTFILAEDLEASDTVTVIVSPGGRMWESKLSTDSEYTEAGRVLDVGTIPAESSVSIDIRAVPATQMNSDMNLIEALMRISSSSLERMIPFSASLIDGELNFIFRSNVFTSDVTSRLAAFGIGIS